jgi:hypothetical protein
MLQFVVLLILFLWSLTTGAKAEQKEIVIEEQIRAAEIEMAEVSGPNAKRSPRQLSGGSTSKIPLSVTSMLNPMRSMRFSSVRGSTTDSRSTSVPLEFDDLEAAVSVEDSHGKRGPSSISNLKYFNSSRKAIGTKVRGRKEKVAMCDAGGARAKMSSSPPPSPPTVEVEMPEVRAQEEVKMDLLPQEAPQEEVQQEVNEEGGWDEEAHPGHEEYQDEYQEDWTATPAAEAEEQPWAGEEEDAEYYPPRTSSTAEDSSGSLLNTVAEDVPQEEEEDELSSVRARLRRVLNESQNQRQTSTDERNNAADNAWDRLMQDSRGDWVEILDDDGMLLGEEFKGRLIYFNKISTEVRFTKPPGWVRMLAEATDSYVVQQRESVTMSRASFGGSARGSLMRASLGGQGSFDFGGSFNGSDLGSSPGSFSGGGRKSMHRDRVGSSRLGRAGSSRLSARASVQRSSLSGSSGGAGGGAGGEGEDEEGGRRMTVEEFEPRTGRGHSQLF